MDRKEFFATSLKASLGCCAFAALDSAAPAAETAAPSPPQDPEKEFLRNWLTDLFDTIDAELDRDTKVRLMAGCGRGCFRRHQFKTEIARHGTGDVDKLLEAYKKNFEVWREADVVHIRYGQTNRQCYCPAARYHPAKPDDIHCECTRATHQAIFETALQRSVPVEVVESLRRGGQTCHFIARLA
jgi:hypothetical protein